jgi:hypothetical protein
MVAMIPWSWRNSARPGASRYVGHVAEAPSGPRRRRRPPPARWTRGSTPRSRAPPRGPSEVVGHAARLTPISAAHPLRCRSPRATHAPRLPARVSPTFDPAARHRPRAGGRAVTLAGRAAGARRPPQRRRSPPGPGRLIGCGGPGSVGLASPIERRLVHHDGPGHEPEALEEVLGGTVTGRAIESIALSTPAPRGPRPTRRPSGPRPRRPPGLRAHVEVGHHRAATGRGVCSGGPWRSPPPRRRAGPPPPDDPRDPAKASTNSPRRGLGSASRCGPTHRTALLVARMELLGASRARSNTSGRSVRIGPSGRSIGLRIRPGVWAIRPRIVLRARVSALVGRTAPARRVPSPFEPRDHLRRPSQGVVAGDGQLGRFRPGLGGRGLGRCRLGGRQRGRRRSWGGRADPEGVPERPSSARSDRAWRWAWLWACSSRLAASTCPWPTANCPIMRAIWTCWRPRSTKVGSSLRASSEKPIGA